MAETSRVARHDPKLSEATQAQLVEELARRLNKSTRDEPPDIWCDSCAHFRTGTDFEISRASWNPCSKGHVMSFYVPQDSDGPETFGYFIEVCADRAPMPEPTPPDPPHPPAPPPADWEHPDFRMEPPPRGRKPKIHG